MEGQNGDRRLQVMLDQEDRFLPTPNYLKRIQSASVLHQQRRMEILTAVYDVSSRCVYVYIYIPCICASCRRSTIYSLLVKYALLFFSIVPDDSVSFMSISF